MANDRDANIKLSLQTDIGNSDKVLAQVSDRLAAINTVVKQSETAFAAWGEASKKAQSLSVFAEGYAYLQEDAAKAVASANSFFHELIQAMEAAGVASGKYALDITGISEALQHLSLEIEAAKGAPKVLKDWLDEPGIFDSIAASASNLTAKLEEAYEVQQTWSFLQEDTARALKPVVEIWGEWGQKLSETTTAVEKTASDSYELAKSSDSAGAAMRALANSGSVATEMWKEIAETISGPVKEAFRGGVEDTQFATGANEKLTESFEKWKSEMSDCVPGVQQVGDAVDWLKGRDKELEESVDDLRVKYELLGTEDLQKLARAERDAAKATEEHTGALHALKEAAGQVGSAFDKFAESSTDATGRVLESTSKLVQATGSHEGEVWENIQNWGFGAAIEKIIDDIKKANKEVPDLLAQNENAQKAWNADTNDAQEEFLKKHKENQDKIGEVDEDFFQKTGKQLPQAMRNRYLMMGQEAGTAVRQVIAEMAAAGKSLDEIQDKIRETSDNVNPVADKFVQEMAKTQTKFKGNIQGLVADIPTVIPLIEQVQKAGVSSGEALVAMGKKYDEDVANQKKMVTSMADDLGASVAQIKSATAEYEKFRKTKGEDAAETIAAKNRVAALTASHAEKEKEIYDAIKARDEENKKRTADMIALAETMSKAFGGTRDEALKMIIAQSAADAKTKEFAEKRAQDLATEQQKNQEIAKTIVSTANLTKDQLYSMLSNMDGITDKSEANTKRIITERMALVKQVTDQTTADEKTAAEETKKAVEEAEKAKAEAIKNGFEAMKAEATEAFKQIDEGVANSAKYWHQAMAESRGIVGTDEETRAFALYTDKIQESITKTSEIVSARMAQVKGAISNALSSGDAKSAEQLQKGLAAYAQDAESRFKSLANTLQANFDAIGQSHQKLIDDMRDKEAKWTDDREAQEKKATDALMAINTRGAGDFKKYQLALDEINRNRKEAEDLRSTGDEANYQKALALEQRNLELAQQIKGVKMSMYDAMSVSDKERFDMEEQALREQSAQGDQGAAQRLKEMEQLKSHKEVIVDEASAQAQAREIVLDTTARIAQTQREMQEAGRAANEEDKSAKQAQLEAIEHQLDKVKEIVKTIREGAALNLDVSKAEGQIDEMLKKGERPIPITVDTVVAKRQIEELRQQTSTGGKTIAPGTAQAEIEKVTQTKSSLPNVASSGGGVDLYDMMMGTASPKMDVFFGAGGEGAGDETEESKPSNYINYMKYAPLFEPRGGSNPTPIVVKADDIKTALKSSEIGDLTGSSYKETEGLSKRVADALDWASKLSATVDRFGSQQADKLNQTLMEITSGGTSSSYQGPDTIARAAADAFAKTLERGGAGDVAKSAFDPAVMSGFNDAVKTFVAAQKETKITVVNKSDDFAQIERV